MPPPPPPPALTDDLRVLPAENFGTVAAGIVTFWDGLRGLTPWRSFRCWVENFPKPVKLISPPWVRISWIESSTASTCSAASFLEPGLAQGLDRGDRGAAGGDHILDETGQLSRFEDALEAVRGPVLLRLPAHDQEGNARGERGGGGQRDRAELGAGQAHGIRLNLGNGLRDSLPPPAEQVRPRPG